MMRCLSLRLSPYAGEVGERIKERVTVNSIGYTSTGRRIWQNGRAFTPQVMQINFVGSYGENIETKYTGEKANILNLKRGDSIKIEGIVRYHRQINGEPITIVSHVKNLSS